MRKTLLLLSMLLVAMGGYSESKSWSADNGNGTYTNPLTYDEFSDPARRSGAVFRWEE